MTDSNLTPKEKNTAPEGAFGIGSKKSDDFSKNEKLRNTGIKDIPRVLREKLFEQSGAVMFPEQITPDVVKKSQKSQQQLFEAKTEEDQRFFRAMGAGVLDIPNEIKNISDWAMGNPYDPNQLINLKALGFEKDGDKDDALYNITKFATGFLLPYAGFSKALTKGGKAVQGIKGIKAIKNVKYADKVATGAKWFTAGAGADFVGIDAYDENLFNFMMGVENPIINNGFVKPFFEYLAAPEKPDKGDPSNFGEAKLKQLYSGAVFGELIGGIFVVGTKLAPKAGRALAEGAEIAVDAVTGGPKIFSQKQIKDETIKLFRDIKNNPNRKNFFLRKKRRIDNAKLVGSEEFSDEFKEVLDNVPDLNETVGSAGGTKPPRKPPAGSGADADIPDDGLPLLKSKPNPNVWGVEGDPDVLKITSDMWEATGKALNRVTIPDDFSVEAASAMGYDYLLPAVTKLAKLISPNAPEKHMRVLYLGAIKENKRLATEISKSMTSIEEAFLLGQKVPDELLTKWSGDVIDLIRLTGPAKTISSETAGTVRINQLIDAEPKNLAKTSVDEEVGTAPFGAPGGQTMADRVKQEKFRPTTKQLVEKAKKEITEKKAVPTKEELIEGLKGYIEGNDVDGLLGITRKVLAMQGDGKRLSKLVDGMTIKDRLGRGLRISNEIFINSLLTAPETHIVNIVGSLMNVALGPLDLAAGSPIMDTEMKARAVRELVKIFTSTGDNLKAAGKALWLDKNILDERRMFGQDQYERYAIRMAGDSLFAKTINFAGHGFRIPGRFMMAGDEFVKQAAFRSHLWGEFSEQATKKGLTGKSWKIYVNSNFDEVIDIVNKQSIREGTDEYILDAYTRALDYAADRTFTEELGKGFFMSGVGSKRTKELANILKSSPLKPVVPFVTTPINIGKHVLRRTPATSLIPGLSPTLDVLASMQLPGLPPKANYSLGRILKEHNDRLMSDDLATAYRANGEATVGGAIYAYFIALAAARQDPEAEIALIGGGHHNRWLREGERRTNELPYSFRLLQKDENGEIIRGDNGLPDYEYIDIFSRMEPVGSLLMIAGDMEYCRDFMSDEDYNNAAQCQRALLSRNLNNKYMIQNIAQMFDLTSDVNALRRFYQIPVNYFTSITLPPASMLRSIKRARGEEWYDEMTQRMYKGRFPKRKTKLAKGDLQPQVERKADKGQYSETENLAGYEFEGNDLGSLMNENNPFQDLNTLGLMVMRNYQDQIPGFSADLAPIKSMTTGKLAEYPEGLMGINFGNPFKYRKEVDNPQDEYLRRIKFKMIPPSDVIPFGEKGFVGVNLTTPEYNDLKRLVSDIPLNFNGKKPVIDLKNGIRFPEILLQLSRKKQNIELLKIIESDTSGSIDAQANLKKKQLFLKQLQAETRKFANSYKEAAVEYYKKNLLDEDKKTMAENELRRGTNDILKTLEGINLN